ncbi:hypothetical protein [Actinoallomurus soli]|uniref:hypothetical protein n=1 Tax=Actinoallomurus soli TaxID=2952535 RepID=UPI002093716A|nr:hypothetical protein [Actinoallomurus soli]MCO5974524.1 hypothetical protein [Actinoallomurus soli]
MTVADEYRPGRATVAVTRPRPSAQAQAMVAALRHQAACLHDAPDATAGRVRGA